MKLYYRLRKQGALVFRLEVSNRQRRIVLNQIATITNSGAIEPHKRRPATEAELAEIEQWWRDWCSRRDTGALAETERFMAELNQFTNWIAKEAEDGEIDSLSDPLLMALLDLRQVVVRRLSEVEAEHASRPVPKAGGDSGH